MTGMPWSYAFFTTAVSGLASFGEMISRSMPWERKFSTSATCLLLSCAASETTTLKPSTFFAALTTSSFMTCRYGSALFAWDMPIRYSLPGPHLASAVSLAPGSSSTLHAAVAASTQSATAASSLLVVRMGSSNVVGQLCAMIS